MRNIFTERMDPSVKGNRNDPVKVAPQVYKVLLENDQVRLLEITLNPGGKVPMHSHPDYVIYCLSAGKVRFTSPEGQTAEPEMKKGDVIWRPSESHAAENIGDTKIQVLNIELKQPSKAEPSAGKVQPEMDPVKVAPSMYQSLFENDRVRVCKATQRPGEKAPMHSHPNHLAYFLDGGRVTFAYPDGKAKDLDVKAGSATWIPGESHEVENSGDAAMEVLVVEIK